MDDGSLLFPERLTREFLDQARRTMGSYLYANQYQNEIIPLDKQTFKKEWVRYYESLPDILYNFAFIDPAISQADTADYSGIVVVATDTAQNWYVRFAGRFKFNPSQLIEQCFRIHEQYKPMAIGIEDVAFQRAIIHFAHEEMRRRNHRIPITGVKRGTDKSKEMRILGLVPRFEWGTIFLNRGLTELEQELAKFPRAQHDDILDALSSIEDIAHYPSKPRSTNVPLNPNDPGYEKQYIENLYKRNRGSVGGDE